MGGVDVDDPKQSNHGGCTVHLPQLAHIDATFRRYQLVDPKLFSTSIDHQVRHPTDQPPVSTVECAITRDVPHREAAVTFTWAAVATRSDTTSTAATVARFAAKPGSAHWEAIEWIPRYPPDTHDLHFMHGEQPTRVRSTSGHACPIDGSTIPPSLGRQEDVPSRTIGSGHVAATHGGKEASRPCSPISVTFCDPRPPPHFQTTKQQSRSCATINTTHTDE